MIKKFRKKCSKIDIVVIRRGALDAHLGNSRPCSVCLNMMQLLNFKNVHYSDVDGDIVSEKISNMRSNHLSQIHRMSEKNGYY